ncbi:hypothetical protein G9A89_003223 [Geosiphon pyriformis]|nr:hypothetical protein G9A89_003223 [Geosiphon pyriformis]
MSNILDNNLLNEQKNQVTLSPGTQALLDVPKSGHNSPRESSEDEETSSNVEERSWDILNSLLKTLGENSNEKDGSRGIHKADTRAKLNRRRTKGGTPISEPLTEEQLSAPYVEEKKPEKPEYINRPWINDDINSSETPLNGVDGKDAVEEQPHGSTPKHHLRDKFKKAIALNTVNRALGNANGRKHLKDINTYSVLMPAFPSPLAVPYLWASKDAKGRRAPPVLLDVLKLAITDSHYDPSLYNFQSIFRIELEYGDVKWVIHRTGYEFAELAFSLKSRDDLPELPSFPAGIARWFRKFWSGHSSHHQRHTEAALERRKELEKYLLKLLKVLNFHVCYDLYEFLELSAISITRDMGWKGKEGYMSTKVQRLRTPICSFSNSSERWEKEWVLIRDSYIAFCSDIDSRTPADVFLLDDKFSCTKVESGMSMFKLHDHISVQNHSRRIEIKADMRKLNDFMESIKRVELASPWVRQHRYDSYAPIREHSKVKWYVDGKDYFYAVSEAILAAKTEIYIEDWWLSPELYLRRPPTLNKEYRLDSLLLKKAEEGVMIYIVVYKEVSVAFSMDSQHTKFYLKSLHPNIQVQRHPDHGPEGVMLWTKIVVVDCRIAFIGGLDLCFGRYDTHTHQLSDFHPNGEHTIWPGQDYSNPRVKDFDNVAKYEETLVDKTLVPRMPWHDVSVGLVGPPARDVARHFVQRWNFIKEEKAAGRTNIPYLLPKGEYVSTRDESRFRGTCEVQLLRSSAYWSSGIKLEHSIYRAYRHLISISKHFIYIENQFFVTATEKDPNYAVKNLIGEAIVDRIKKAANDHEKFRVIVVMPLLPAFQADLNSKEAGTIRMVMHWQYVSICRGGRSVLEKIAAAGIDPKDYISFFALRGYDRIKQPIKEDSDSQNNDAIQQDNSLKQKGKANRDETSLPSESQSILEQKDVQPEDKTLQQLETQNLKDSIAPNAMERSVESLDSQQPTQTEDNLIDEQISTGSQQKSEGAEPIPSSTQYLDSRSKYVTEELYIHSKVLIVDDRYVICGSANLNDRSQLGNRDSEIAILIEDKLTVPTRMNGQSYEASKFAYTLRSNLFKEHLGLLPSQDHTTVTKSCIPPINPEELYDVSHGKDRISTSDIIGESSTGYLPKHPTKEDLAVMDPLSDEFYNYWQKTAQNNTEAFRDVFRCVPDDNVTDWVGYKNFVPDPTKVPTGHVANTQKSVEEVREKLNQVRGHLVVFPTEFLKDENLLGSVISNAVTPAEIFT